VSYFLRKNHRTKRHSVYLTMKTIKLKVLTNEKKGGLEVVAFDRSLFKLFTLIFSDKSVQAPSSERPKSTQRTLFLSFEINNCLHIMHCKKCKIQKNLNFTQNYLKIMYLFFQITPWCRETYCLFWCKLRFLKCL
jgi:hypothetical protein